MDVNRQAYFLLREPEEFANRSSRLLWDDQREAFILAQNQLVRLPVSDATNALITWQNTPPLIVDQYQQQCRIAASGNELEYNSGRGFLPLVDGNLQRVDAPAGLFTDVAIGGDGRLAATYSDNAESHGVLVFHLGRRWQAAANLPERPVRVWVDQHNKVWCASNSSVICCEGEPLPHSYQPDSTRFEPVTLNQQPLRIVWQTRFSINEFALALCSDDTQLAVLIHDGNGVQHLLVRPLSLTIAGWQRYPIHSDCPFGVDVRFLSKHRLAIMAPAQSDDTDFVQRDCPIVQCRWDVESNEGTALLVRERYPMLSQAQARFACHAQHKVCYQARVDTDSEQAKAGFEIYHRELLPLHRPRYLSAAMATLTEPLDTGLPDTTWHRIYLEGCIPSGCKVIVYAKTYNTPEQRVLTPFIRQPDWVWCQHRSEQAFGQGLVAETPNESGLFELLLQRDTGPVRRLNGRYLQLRLRLESNGHYSPAIHALKIYYPRFSYQEAYLPEHMRQEYSVEPNLDGQAANGADFRERLLATFEGVLTPLEGKIASSEILLSPEHTPAEHLPWLAELFGQTLPTHWPVARQRRWLKESGNLQRCRGTLAGINLALDIASDGGVQRGQIVVVENFRLRRTMATILGLNVDDTEHPLTLGTGVSGNSLVGESLILSDADAREFFSLFAPEFATDQETEIVEEFFDQYAHQVTILLHGKARQQRNSITEIVNEQIPAHLQYNIIDTDSPFVLGLSPLLSVDTYLEKQADARPVVLSDTYIGREGLLRNNVALSPQDVF
jgi:phage tail-like protein